MTSLIILGVKKGDENMIYAAALMAIGYHTLMSANGSKLWMTIGIALYIFCMIVGQTLEDRLNNKIKSLEKELKEMKTNDQRNSL